ncbi:MAG: aminoglycoside phosphotransferase family protein [Cyanobacteriota bacterium]|nr:aminoglycoside phosphotransferase family protein [Cyanobacteriota bacterium]
MNIESIAQQIHHHWQEQGSLETPRLLAHGESNLIFRLGEDRLMRVAVTTPNQRFAGDPQRVTAFESAILHYLAGTGISHQLLGSQLSPTPELPYTYLITNFLEGESLNYRRDHLAKAAQTLACLHRLPSVHTLVPPLQPIDEPLTLFLRESQRYAQPYLKDPKADPDIVEMLQIVLMQARRLQKQETDLQRDPYVCLVHGDHTHDNWLINSQQAHLIDWEWAELSTPAADLGHFLSPVTIHRYHHYQLPVEDREFFLNHYWQALDHEPLRQTLQNHWRVFGAFPAIRSLCWTAGQWTKGDPWYSQAGDASSQVRLARQQASHQHFSRLWEGVMQWIEEVSGL